MKKKYYIQDFMFGDQILPEKRLETHQAVFSGVFHACQVQPARPRSDEQIILRVTTGGEKAFDRVRLVYTLDDSAPQPETSLALEFRPAGVTWDMLGWQYVQHWQAVLPAQPDQTMIRYLVAARRAFSDTWVYADNQAGTPTQATCFALWVNDAPAAAWHQQALVYHVFIDRFNPGAGQGWKPAENLSGFFGGTLRGVIEKLDYIQGLGYNTIWLSPFFVSNSHHGYDAIDMYRVEPRYGTNEDLFELIEALHRRGMRIILDFVANHWSNLHFTLQEAQKERNSPYYDWYLWKEWPGRYEGYFGLLEMPKLNLKLGMPARQYLLDCARFWLERGFDGFRCDFAYGPPMDFWVDFRRACKTAKPDCWLFAEVIQSADQQKPFAVAFDGIIDFLLADALRQTLGFGRWSLERFESFLQRHETYFGSSLDRLTILDNHDMNRFLYMSDDDPQRLKLGALALYTLPGMPINYYGTEAGVSQALPIHHDDRGFFEEARAPMLWGSEQMPGLAEYFRSLVALRKTYPFLAGGERHTLHLDEAGGTYAYLRSGGQGQALVLLNTSREERTLKLRVENLHGSADLLSGKSIRNENGEITAILAPQTGMVIV